MKSFDDSTASRDIAHVLHPYTNLKKHQETGPLVLTEAKAYGFTTTKAMPTWTGWPGSWCVALGYGEKRLVEAAAAQMRRLPFSHLFVSKSHEPAVNLAEKLIAIAPAPMSKVFFANSGSEATDTALKLIWFYNNALGRSKKKKIIWCIHLTQVTPTSCGWAHGASASQSATIDRYGVGSTATACCTRR